MPGVNRPHGTKTKYKDLTFDSRYEASVAQYLDDLGIQWEYHPIRLPWVPAVQYYTPDFRLTFEDGTSFLLETKGCFDQTMRSKMRQLKIQYPSLDLRMMFMTDQPLKSGSPTLYTDWARQNKYKCETKEHIHEILQTSRKKTKRTVRSTSTSNKSTPQRRRRKSRRTSSVDSGECGGNE